MIRRMIGRLIRWFLADAPRVGIRIAPGPAAVAKDKIRGLADHRPR